MTEKNHANAIPTAETPAVFLSNRLKKGIGFLEQQTAAITGLAICANGTTMIHSIKGTDCGAHQAVARFTVYVGNQAKATIIFAIIPIIYGHQLSPSVLLTNY